MNDVELVVSELVTNAVLHASSEVEVSVALEREDMTIEVSDQGDDGLAALSKTTADDEFGRGLGLVQALSEAWGSRRRPDGTTVWCTIRRGGPS